MGWGKKLGAGFTWVGDNMLPDPNGFETDGGNLGWFWGPSWLLILCGFWLSGLYWPSSNPLSGFHNPSWPTGHGSLYVGSRQHLPITFDDSATKQS